jgi:hypothetical protein
MVVRVSVRSAAREHAPIMNQPPGASVAPGGFARPPAVTPSQNVTVCTVPLEMNVVRRVPPEYVPPV